MTFDDLLLRFAAEVQDRQLHVVRTYPDIATGGFDVDLQRGAIRFRASGRTCPIQVIGSEAGGSWLWGWANSSFASPLVERATRVCRWAEGKDLAELTTDGFDLPDQSEDTLSGMSLSVIVAGITDAAAVYCCHDRARDARLYVTLEDDTLREPPDEDPLLRITLRYPAILALANHPAHDGGVPIVDWVRGLDGYCRAFGVNGKMLDESSIELRHGELRANVRYDGRQLDIQYQSP